METAEKTKPERTPILSVSTLAPTRPLADIDEVPHEFRLIQDFGSIEHAEWTRDVRRYDELWGAEKRSKAEDKELDRLLDRLFDQVFVDSKALRDQLGEKLTGAIKRECVLTFTNAPQLMQLMALQDQATDEAGNDSST